MLTPNTPLPELMKENARFPYITIESSISELITKFNQLLTNFKEREELEAMAGVPDSVRGVQPDAGNGLPYVLPEKPSLKERLVREIAPNCFIEGTTLNPAILYKDLEAIINKVFRDNAK